MNTGVTLDYLKAEDTPLRRVLDSIFDGVYIVDRQRSILFWNHGAEEITGYTAEEVMGRLCSDDILNHIDESGRLLCKGACPLVRSLTTGEEIRAKIYPLNKAGHRFPVLTHIAPLRDSEGNVIAAIEVFRDVSTEEDFRVLQEKFNTLVQRYVSKSTYEEIMEQVDTGNAGKIQSRDLTIFYLDIVGFTPLSERHRPEEVVSILNNIFGMCDVITRENHGDIDKFIGDALMAVFIDANDAVEACMKILGEALPHFNSLRAEEGAETVEVRIGINSGMVVQGDVGTTDRKDLTVIGDVVNTAQRIEAAATPNSVLLSESCYARLAPGPAARFMSHGEVQVKGKNEPVRVYTPRPAGDIG